MKLHPTVLLAFLLPVLLVGGAIVAVSPLRASDGVAPVFSDKGVAIKGYDPVAYFEQGAPVEGSPGVQYEWNGAVWHFANKTNRDKFAADPEAYAPQYGGYCAWAVSQGKTAPIDPEAWEIVGGKLYLNYSSRIQKKWQKDRDTLKKKADQNWPTLHE